MNVRRRKAEFIDDQLKFWSRNYLVPVEREILEEEETNFRTKQF